MLYINGRLKAENNSRFMKHKQRKVSVILLSDLLPSGGNLPLKSYWSLTCDHGLQYSDELT